MPLINERQYMFKFIKRLTKSKNENSVRFRYDMARHLDGRHIRYVTERDNTDNTDIIVGREGCLAIHDDEFIVLSDGVTKFRCKIRYLQASELLSLEGVILTGPDLENNETERTIIAYYKYYR